MTKQDLSTLESAARIVRDNGDTYIADQMDVFIGMYKDGSLKGLEHNFWNESIHTLIEDKHLRKNKKFTACLNSENGNYELSFDELDLGYGEIVPYGDKHELLADIKELKKQGYKIDDSDIGATLFIKE